MTRSSALPVLCGIATGLVAVVFIVLTGTGAPGAYGAVIVGLLLSVAMLAWDDRRQARRQR